MTTQFLLIKAMKSLTRKFKVGHSRNWQHTLLPSLKLRVSRLIHGNHHQTKWTGRISSNSDMFKIKIMEIAGMFKSNETNTPATVMP
jgi:hypothetical protein